MDVLYMSNALYMLLDTTLLVEIILMIIGDSFICFSQVDPKRPSHQSDCE